MDLSFYKNRRVLVTGHTGFKGSWLGLLLNEVGADVYGYALNPPTDPSLFNEAQVGEVVTSHIGDIRNINLLQKKVEIIEPEIVIHMAAQSLVRESFSTPVETYEVNVMGAVNILEVCRSVSSVKAIIIVTSDKCYENREWQWGYREIDSLGGYDPYSNSKGCAEMVTSAYRASFYHPDNYLEHGVAVASVRAGNVIGGGDWAIDRLIPDFIRSILAGDTLHIRSPHAIRPWQHVMEPLTGYLLLAENLFNKGSQYAEAWNFGPDDSDAKSVEWIARMLCNMWGESAKFEIMSKPQVHEAKYLKLDCSKAKAELNWRPHWSIDSTLESIVEWNKSRLSGANIRDITLSQIKDYLSL
jgi:CDP-glucose 4,6-dehydratase